MGACTALLAISAGLRSPGERSAIWKDLSNDTTNALTGLMTFKTRVTDDLFRHSNQTVINAFAHYISPQSAGFSSTLTLTDQLPPDWAGMYVSGHNTIKMQPYQSKGMAKHVAMHEYCHAYTHPDFSDRFIKLEKNGSLTTTPDDRLIYEVFTDYIACKLHKDRTENRPQPCGGAETAYRFTNLQGIHLFSAVEKIEAIVGEDVLLRAFFSGDRDAIQTLSRVSVGNLPKFINFKTLNAIFDSIGKAKPANQKILDECLLGAQLVFSDVNVGSYTERELFQYCKQECARVRNVIGHDRFDQAFYNFDTQAALEAFNSIKKDLIKHWRPYQQA